MTTIAFRDGTLAADTSPTVGGARGGFISKIVRGPSGDLAGAAGTAGYCHKFRRWVAGGEAGAPPEPRDDKDSFDRGVIFRRSGVIDIHEPQGMFTIRAKFFAIGSGRCEALGAMHMGATAKQAVEVAKRVDIYTFGKIETLTHDAPKRQRRKRA